jgi:lipopolysaccharide biosynthesis protein
LEAIRHYLSHGLRENRLYEDFNAGECADRFYSVWDMPERRLPAYRPCLRVCVLVHIFYPELYEELKQYLGNLSGFEYDIYFNLVENNWTSRLHNTVMTDFPTARVIVSKNKGKDIGGHFNLIGYIKHIREYDAFLLIHSKKSPHIPEAASTKWRRDLLGATIGSPLIVAQNLYLLEKFPDTGLIGSKFWRHRSIDGNTKKYRLLLKRLGIPKKDYRCDYLSGTMMWLNARAVDYLYSKCRGLEFEDGNDQSEQFHKDGQWAHAMERSIGNICRQLSLTFVFR